jgi:hypothetical protein
MADARETFEKVKSKMLPRKENRGKRFANKLPVLGFH